MVSLEGLGAGAAGGAVVAIVIKATDEFSSTFDKAGTKLSFLEGAAAVGVASVAALGVAVLGTASVFGEFAIKAAEAGDVQEAFNRLAGQDGVEALDKMTAATLGTINQVDLMKAANQALIRGMNDEDLPTLAKFSQQLSDLGQGNTVENIDAITQALATGRTAHLKSMGVVIDENQVYKDAAISLGLYNEAQVKSIEEAIKQKEAEIDKADPFNTSSRHYRQMNKELEDLKKAYKDAGGGVNDFGSLLSDTQKKSADHDAILKSVAETSKKLPEPTTDAADSVKKLSAAWDNAQVSMGNAIAPMVQDIATGLLPVFKSLMDFINEFVLPPMQTLFSSFSVLTDAMGKSGDGTHALVTALGYIVTGLIDIVSWLVLAAAGFVKITDFVYEWGTIIVDVVQHKVIAAFQLFQNSWALTKNLFKLGVDEMLLGAELMANGVIKVFENMANTVIGWVNTIISVYNRMSAAAPVLGLGHITPFGNADFSGSMFNTASLQNEIHGLSGDVAKNVNNISINIEQLSGVDPREMAEALRKELNNLVAT